MFFVLVDFQKSKEHYELKARSASIKIHNIATRWWGGIGDGLKLNQETRVPGLFEKER